MNNTGEKIGILKAINGSKFIISFIVNFISYILALLCMVAGIFAVPLAIVPLMLQSENLALPSFFGIIIGIGSVLLCILIPVIFSIAAIGIKSCFTIGIKAYLKDDEASVTELFKPFLYFFKAIGLYINRWGKTAAFIVVPQIVLNQLFAFATLPDLYAFWVLTMGIIGTVLCVIGSLKYIFADNIISENPNITYSTSKDEYLREHLAKHESKISRFFFKLWYLFCYNTFEKTGITRTMDRSDELTNKNKPYIFRSLLTIFVSFIVFTVLIAAALIFLIVSEQLTTVLPVVFLIIYAVFVISVETIHYCMVTAYYKQACTLS